METVFSSPIDVTSRVDVDSGLKTLSCEMLSEALVVPTESWFLSLKTTLNVRQVN